jgi:hypothetical protein
MNRLSKRDMLIFVVGLLLGAALIGLGVAYVIQIKQRILPGSRTGVLSLDKMACFAMQGGDDRNS